MGKPAYNQGKGDDLHRRSLYTFWKRTVPPPAMMTFDAADRSYCSVRRQSTSTPLQALTLLNDVQFVESARFIGQRMLRAPGELARQDHVGVSRRNQPSPDWRRAFRSHEDVRGAACAIRRRAIGCEKAHRFR
jgi:hypothetical protein